jgi:sugar phosphate isomerase/epimerase
MIMQFGMPTLIEIKSIKETAALCRELELKFVELNMNLPEYQVNRLDTLRLAEIANKYGIYYTIHLDENLNPCDFNERVSTAYTETVMQTIGIAKKMNAPILNMHLTSGVYFTLPEKKVFLFEEYTDDFLKRLAIFRDDCTVAIGNANIKICVENCGEYARVASSFVKKGLTLLLESPAFGLTFDVGHNAAADYSDEPTIMDNADRLLHFHIHDAKGRSNHLPLGDGDVDLLKYLKLAKDHNCRTVLETKTVDALRRSVGWLKARKI